MSLYFLTHYTLKFIYTSLSEAIDTLHEVYLPFCYELALETSAKRSSIKSLWVHDLYHAHSLAILQWSGPSDQWTLLPTENCLQCQKWSPKKGRESLSTPVCVKMERNGQASDDQGFSTASQGSCHVHGILRLTHPPPPIPPFLLTQNLSSKRITPTNNMRPNFARRVHSSSVVKGLKTVQC